MTKHVEVLPEIRACLRPINIYTSWHRHRFKQPPSLPKFNTWQNQSQLERNRPHRFSPLCFCLYLITSANFAAKHKVNSAFQCNINDII